MCANETQKKWIRKINRIIHKKYDHNVFIRCQCRQNEKGDTALHTAILREQIHYALLLKQVVKAMKWWWDLVKGYYCLDWTCPYLLPLGELSWAQLDCSSRRANSLSKIKPPDVELELLLATCEACRGHRHPSLASPILRLYNAYIHLSQLAGVRHRQRWASKMKHRWRQSWKAS